MAKLKWNRDALRKIRYGDADPRVIEHLNSIADDLADDANKGARAHNHQAEYKTSSQPGRRKPQGRHRVTVITANAEAMVDNQAHNRLLQVLLEKKAK